MSEHDLGTVTLSADGPAPQVEIEFGYVLAGGYRLYLWDPNVASIIGSGVNTDSLPDVHPIGKTADLLDGHVVSVELKIATIPGTNADPGGPYSAKISVTQGGAHAAGSPLSVAGNLVNGTVGLLRYIALKT